MADDDFLDDELDEDDDYEPKVIYLGLEGAQKHDVWTVVTGLLALFTNLFADVSDFFGTMTRASTQHNEKRKELDIMHEQVGREIDSLPSTDQEV